MAAALLVGLLCDNEDEDEHENRNVMTERLLRPHNDALHFPDHILISLYRLPRQLILNLVEELRPALERPTRRLGWSLASGCAGNQCSTFFCQGGLPD